MRWKSIPLVLIVPVLFQVSAWSLTDPLFQTVDLDVGETTTISLPDGSAARVTLENLREEVDSVTQAVRKAVVTVNVSGNSADLVSATYHLPQRVGGVQIDCPITKGYHVKGRASSWGLEKDARLRIWPAKSPWIRPGSFRYPARQKWFATDTQMANEPVHVDGGERPDKPSIYYHSGLDIGGSEGQVEILAAVDGTVVSAAGFTLLEHRHDTPVSERYDVVYLLDERGWYYRNSHLQKIDPRIKPGTRVKQGDRIGWLGKEGGSGGWTHLHFEIKSRQPSGKWGTQEAYAFLWQAYLSEQKPDLLAVARPHQLLWAGESALLDGSRSWAASGKITHYEWTFGDGTRASGPRVRRLYQRPGRYSEVLKVTDAHGKSAYDFAVVIVYDRNQPERHITTLHPVYFPTQNIHPEDPVTFRVRSFVQGSTPLVRESWDFGDGSPTVEVQSDGNAVKLAPEGYAECTHRFREPGDYVVRVTRCDEDGVMATGHLWVRVEPR